MRVCGWQPVGVDTGADNLGAGSSSTPVVNMPGLTALRGKMHQENVRAATQVPCTEDGDHHVYGAPSSKRGRQPLDRDRHSSQGGDRDPRISDLEVRTGFMTLNGLLVGCR